MNKTRLVKLCLEFDDAIETYPFKDTDYNNYAVIRHISNNKWFALIFYLEGKLFINLKCRPVDAGILRDTYQFITPAWHMNKSHWIKVDPLKCPKDLLKSIIKNSYELTTPKKKIKKS